MFVVQVAADIFGNKLNYEFSSPSRPSLAELTRTIEAAFSTTISQSRPDGVPPHTFHVGKIKVYDEEKGKWVDLVGEGQLLDYAQLYAFQPENPWHKETQKAIPPATKPPTPRAASTAAGAITSTSSAAPNTSRALAPYTGSGSGTRGDTSNPSSSRRPYTAAGGSTALVPKVSADASPEEKLRVVFAEFDTKGTRLIELEDFRQGFRAMGLDLSSATIEDLFERADLNHDRRISFSEFERFARLYPIMTDCMFFRSKAFWEEEQMRKDIQGDREALAKMDAAVDQQQAALEDAEGDVVAAQNAVRQADQELQDRTDRMRDLARDVDDARKEKDRALRDKKDREAALEDIKEREKEARKELQDTARDGDKLDRRAAALANDAAAADDKVRQLQKALEDAKRAADRAHQAAEQAAAEADAAKEKEKDAAMEADAIAREVPKAEDLVRQAERNVSAAEQALKDLDSIGKDLGREADEAARRRDAGEKAVQEAKDKVAQRAKELDQAKRQLDDREQAVKQKELDLDEHRRQRDLVSQHERTLIEQELRLREQRDSLEQRETKLLSEASNFLTNMRNTVSSRSRDPSAF